MKQTADQLDQAEPVISTIAADPSLHGLAQVMGMIGIGIEQGKMQLDKVAPFYGKMADTIEGALAGRRSCRSRSRISSAATAARAYPNRRFVQIKPKLDYGDLEPGRSRDRRRQRGDPRPQADAGSTA